jgi:hypothetical protein
MILSTDFTRLKLRLRKLSEKITLAVISWYFPEEIRFLIHLELEETWGAECQEVKEVLLTSRDYALTWLIRCSSWNESDFFGNYLNNSFVRLFRLTQFRNLPTGKVEKYTGYCRGYQNSINGVPSSLPRELLAKASVEEEYQRELFLKQQSLLLLKRIRKELYFLQNGCYEVEYIF